MTLEQLVRVAREHGASDIHLEGGLPMALRVRGALRTVGEPVAAAELTALARELLGSEGWPAFVERSSADLSRTASGLRCRINILRSARGVGFAIRLLGAFNATLRSLNLHPDLRRLVLPAHGLVLITGPTGSGKTSTLAALLQEINLAEPRHIVTVEHPIEYALSPRQSFIRQREVGRDTPSFEQALLDALREDPDVLMIGEMREPAVMRLTLNAAETGHLVLATLHSSSTSEALQRIVTAFPSEIQGGICGQLADCFVGAVAQRLRYREDLDLRVPECEVLMANTGVRAVIRSGQFFKLGTLLETSAVDGSYTFARYGEWLQRKTDFERPPTLAVETRVDDLPAPAALEARPKAVERPARVERAVTKRPVTESKPQTPDADGVLVLDEEADPEDVLRELERKR